MAVDHSVMRARKREHTGGHGVHLLDPGGRIGRHLAYSRECGMHADNTEPDFSAVCVSIAFGISVETKRSLQIWIRDEESAAVRGGKPRDFAGAGGAGGSA